MNTEPTTPEEQASLEAHVRLMGTLDPCIDKHEESITVYESYAAFRSDYLIEGEPVNKKAVAPVVIENHKDCTVSDSTLIRFTSIERETAKAICLVIEGTDEWFPKAVCKKLDVVAGTVYVWNKFLKDSKPELLTD